MELRYGSIPPADLARLQTTTPPEPPSRPVRVSLTSAVPILGPTIVLMSHGLKARGLTVPQAHCYLDARALPDANNNPLARDPAWMRAAVDLRPYMQILLDGYSMLPARRDAARRMEPFRVCCLCAFGRHRSVALKQLLAAELTARGFVVEVING